MGAGACLTVRFPVVVLPSPRSTRGASCLGGERWHVQVDTLGQVGVRSLGDVGCVRNCPRIDPHPRRFTRKFRMGAIIDPA